MAYNGALWLKVSVYVQGSYLTNITSYFALILDTQYPTVAGDQNSQNTRNTLLFLFLEEV